MLSKCTDKAPDATIVKIEGWESEARVEDNDHAVIPQSGRLASDGLYVRNWYWVHSIHRPIFFPVQVAIFLFVVQLESAIFIQSSLAVWQPGYKQHRMLFDKAQTAHYAAAAIPTWPNSHIIFHKNNISSSWFPKF